MAKLTLLQMTQKILTAMDSDDINDISDTEEASEVIDIIEDTYYELMTHKEWNHLKTPVNMESLADSDFPTTLKIPDTVSSLENLRYESREIASDSLAYTRITYKSPEEFTNSLFNRNSNDANTLTLTVKGSGTPLLVTNDQAPAIWTSFDDTYIVFDSYDASLESTVQGSKSLAYCVQIPVFNKTDGAFVPTCPIHMFPILLAEAKKACFFYLKQIQSPIDEKRAFRGESNLKFKDARAHEQTTRPRYGRR